MWPVCINNVKTAIPAQRGDGKVSAVFHYGSTGFYFLMLFRKLFWLYQRIVCYNLRLHESEDAGEMDEWLKSHAWKACIGS